LTFFTARWTFCYLDLPAPFWFVTRLPITHGCTCTRLYVACCVTPHVGCLRLLPLHTHTLVRLLDSAVLRSFYTHGWLYPTIHTLPRLVVLVFPPLRSFGYAVATHTWFAVTYTRWIPGYVTHGLRLLFDHIAQVIALTPVAVTLLLVGYRSCLDSCRSYPHVLLFNTLRCLHLIRLLAFTQLPSAPRSYTVYVGCHGLLHTAVIRVPRVAGYG